MKNNFHTIVIGKGLIGSATAKYLAATGKNVAIIGPDEPTQPETATVFASHYDETRVQRILGKDIVWTKLCKDSVENYAPLQTSSGIVFHHTPGCLYVNPHDTDKYLQQVPDFSQRLSLPYREFDPAQFPDFHFPEGSIGIFESSPSGFINPRKLIEAQISLFTKNEGRVINQVVTTISKQQDGYEIKTISGETFYAETVVLCPGAFTNFLGLLPQKLELDLKSETVLFAEISEAEANRLQKLPSLLYEIMTPELNGIYLLPPYQYPDGKYYVKIGCNMEEDIHFKSLEQVQLWFRQGDSDALIPKLKKALFDFMPGLQASNFFTKRCIITYTAHGRSYIGETEKNLFVATGGCGYAAMCSDGIGAVVSNLVRNGEMPVGYDPADFRIVFAEKNQPA